METEVFEVAEGQYGVFHRAQARGRMTDRQLQYRVRQGRMLRELPGVYRAAGVPPSWRTKVEAVSRWVGPRCVFSHQTAARLHGLEDFEEAEAVHVTTQRELRGEGRPGLTVHHASDLSFKDWTDLPELRVTSVARTLLDLAAVLDEAELESAVDDALSKRKVKLEQLENQLARSKGRRGVCAFRKVLEARLGRGLSESKLESKGIEALRAAEMPLPTQQRPYRLRNGRVRVDFVYERERVVIELDGYATHSNVDAFEADRQRDNALAARGFMVLRWTWRALEDRPAELMGELASVLLQRG